MNTLPPELLAMIYHQLMPKDSCRFSLVSKEINNMLPEQQHNMHQWHQRMFTSLNEINLFQYDIHEVIICYDEWLMTIRKNYNKVSIYQINADNKRLCIYTYLGRNMKCRHIINR